MKIRTDFVTNSSSTCFVLVCRGSLSFAAVCRLLGAPDEGPLCEVARGLYQALDSNRWTKDRLAEWCGHDNRQPDDWVTKEFDGKVAKKVAEAEHKGYQVYMGRLSTEEEGIQSFFCTESIELESDDLYLSALRVWF